MRRTLPIFLAVLAALVLVAAPGAAAPVGNLESWGTYGLGAGQFANATMFGVDPSDGSVYVGDMTEKVGGGEGVRENFRIQKFSAGGTFQASVLVPRFSDQPTDEELVTLFGVAVDPTLHRLYLLEGARDPVAKEPYAKRILVFSTTPEGNKLVPPTGGPSSLPLPTTGTERILNPTAIAVDPKNHEVEVMGEKYEPEAPSTSRPAVLQRVTSTGTVGPRFTDTAKNLRPAVEFAKTIAIAPDGTTYALTGRPAKGTRTKAWELPESLSEIKEVAGFSAVASAEEWSFGLEQKVSTFTGGPEIAVSPSGETLYFKERIEAWSPPASAGSYLIHGYSLKSKATTVDYGGATSGSCKITSADAMFGVTGEGATEKVVVLDPGQPNEEEQQAPNFGGKVLTFGRGGSGCPVPEAKFKVNGVEENAEVAKNTTATFDASGSVLTSGPTATKGFVKEAIWKFGDGFEQTVTSSGSTEAPLTTTHVYATGGTYTATLQIRFKKPTYGNPLLVEHKVVVSGGGTEEFALKASKEGSGTLSSSPGGISCGSTCEAKFAKGTLVKVTATPETGFKAATWTGCDAVTAGVCEVTMSAAKNVKATFAHEPVQLTVKKEGTGSGTVTSSPTGIACGSTCSAAYEFEAEVTLTAVSEAGTAPVLWAGCDSEPSATQCKVKMSAARTVTATFSPVGVAALAVEKKGSGTGTVTSSPTGINCGTTCSAQFETGKLVKLTATPGSGSKAATWSGCDAVAAGVCEVTVSASRTVTATFEAETRALKVNKAGSGAGTVTSLPTGINCGSTCEASFAVGTLVKLTGAPASGSKAATWTGCDAVASGVCEVTVSAAKEVTATFEPEPTPPGPKTLTVVEEPGTNAGTVTSSPAGISCHLGGGACSNSFAEGTEVTLTGVADAGAEPVVWTGCDSKPSPTECKVTMSAAKTVTAAFEPTRRQLTVERAGSGSGTVSSEPAGIECGSTCAFGFSEGTAVKLTGTPATGSGPARWSGCDTVTAADQCEVKVAGARKVIAAFPLQGRLTVAKLGTARGSVSSSPAGISCGGTCAAAFGIGETVTLTAFSAAGAKPAVWSGCDAVTTSNLCVVLVGAASEVAATFEPTAATPPSTGTPPAEEVTTKKKSKLQVALARCQKQKGKAKQRKCERKARAKYGKKKPAKKKPKKSKQKATKPRSSKKRAENGGHG
jgi:hypothetical protein